MDSRPAPVTPDILADVRRGNEAVARELVEMLYPLVISIVRRHLPRCEAEEDLCQEIFLKMFTRLPQYKSHHPFEHWVSKIALHTCYDRLRRQKSRKVMSFAELDTEESAFVHLTETEEPLEGSPGLARDILEKLFTVLKPNEQMVISLLDLEEHSVKEVCSILGWGASRIRVTAMRARRKLGAALETLEKTSPIHPNS